MVFIIGFLSASRLGALSEKRFPVLGWEEGGQGCPGVEAGWPMVGGMSGQGEWEEAQGLPDMGRQHFPVRVRGQSGHCAGMAASREEVLQLVEG